MLLHESHFYVTTHFTACLEKDVPVYTNNFPVGL